ncbi:hypothetical protein [Maribacter arcticus]|uniref:hypothetical protein n=1 Tax=Maribacter arcticus TaxID=561365 RepID=UPI0030038A9B
MEKILINDFNELIQFLSLPEISKDEVCKIIAGNYGVYADPCKDKGEITIGFIHLWNNYHLKGLETPIFIS